MNNRTLISSIINKSNSYHLSPPSPPRQLPVYPTLESRPPLLILES